MQRRQRHIALEFRQDLRVDQYRPVIVGPAMDAPMSDGDELDLLRLEQPGTGGMDCGGKVDYLVRRIGLVDQGPLVGRLGAQPRPRADAVDLTFDQAFQVGHRAEREHLELEARRARIDDEDRFHVGHAAGKTAARRRASA